MAFCVYRLRCSGGRSYAGLTDALDRRVAEHRPGGLRELTCRRRPAAPAWRDTFRTREEAVAAEARTKLRSRAKMPAPIDGDRARLSDLARPPRERPSMSPGTSGLSGRRLIGEVPPDPGARTEIVR